MRPSISDVFGSKPRIVSLTSHKDQLYAVMSDGSLMRTIDSKLWPGTVFTWEKLTCQIKG